MTHERTPEHEQDARVAFVRAKIATAPGALQVVSIAYGLTGALRVLDARPWPTCTAMRDVELATDAPTERHMSIVLALHVLADCEAITLSVCRDLAAGQVNIDRAFWTASAYVAALAHRGLVLGLVERDLVNAASRIEEADL
ncbi:MAG: hypothetical protein AB7G37_21700 [Solirubrobacteraceae bacterium]